MTPCEKKTLENLRFTHLSIVLYCLSFDWAISMYVWIEHSITEEQSTFYQSSIQEDIRNKKNWFFFIINSFTTTIRRLEERDIITICCATLLHFCFYYKMTRKSFDKNMLLDYERTIKLLFISKRK